MGARSCLGPLLLGLVLLLPAAVTAVPSPTEQVLLSLGQPLGPSVGAAIAHAGGRVVQDFSFARVALVEVRSAAVDDLRAIPGVDGVYAEEQEQLLLASSRPAVRVGPQLWSRGMDGSGAVVAVVDSGIDGNHPGLAGRVLSGVHIDANGVQAGAGDQDGHGTHIAGIIAGNGAGSPGNSHAGMAPGAELVAIDISSAFTTTNAVRAFEWLHDHARGLGVRVVSNSWGREKEGALYDPNDPVIRASDALVGDGMVVVFSAGNLGPGPGTLTVEAQNPNVITVGAASDGGEVEPYSGRGPARLASGGGAAWTKPDIIAPGTSITSTRANPRGSGYDDLYVTLNGTSMAAPHVAGVAALMLSANPLLSPAQVKDLLLRTARDRGAPGPDMETGAGFLDGRAASDAARDLAGTPPPPTPVPFHAQGQVQPGVSVLATAAPQASGEIHRSIMVNPGAVGVSFAFQWDDPQTSFAVQLEKDGRVFGPFTQVAKRGSWMEIDGSVQDALEPGTWTLVAKPSAAVVKANYAIDGNVLVQSAWKRPSPGPLPATSAFPTSLAHEGASLPMGLIGVTAIGASAAGAAAWALGSRRRGRVGQPRAS